MNKTIIININGIIFHIEEDAYEVLKSYMTEVKRHFIYSTDSDEIVTDIENRLAEMFNELLAEQNKQVIVLADVQSITAQMGNVNDFDLADDEEGFKEQTSKRSKALYKDADERIIAGVCSGLAHYFNMDVKWVRLIVGLAALTTGITIIPYIILWWVLPTAVTRKDKMAMKGEAINLQNFKKSFDQDYQSFNAEGDNVNFEPKPIQPQRDPIREIVNFIGKLLRIFIKFVGILIAAFGGITLLCLLIGLIFGLGFLTNTEIQQFPFNVINPGYRSAIYFSIFLLIFIPLIALILFAIRVILNKKIVSRYSSFSMLILWLTGLAMGVYYGSKIAAEFQEEATFEQVSELVYHPTLALTLNQKLFFTKDDSIRYKIGQDGKIKGRILLDRENFGENMQHFELYIDKSDDGTLTVVKELSGSGSNFENALKAAQRISFQVVQKDSIIQFDKYLTVKGNGLYRNQKVDVHLKVPVNTRLIIDGNLDSQLRNATLWYCRPEDSDSDLPTEWIMTEEGLKCADAELYERKRNR